MVLVLRGGGGNSIFTVEALGGTRVVAGSLVSMVELELWLLGERSSTGFLGIGGPAFRKVCCEVEPGNEMVEEVGVNEDAPSIWPLEALLAFEGRDAPGLLSVS